MKGNIAGCFFEGWGISYRRLAKGWFWEVFGLMGAFSGIVFLYFCLILFFSK